MTTDPRGPITRCHNDRVHLSGAVMYFNSTGQGRATQGRATDEDDYYCATTECQRCAAKLVTYNVAESGLPIWEVYTNGSAWRTLVNPSQLSRPYAITEEP